MPIIRLAWVEFIRPFRHFRAGTPGGRDFVWLSLLLVLVLTLGLLLRATREGLLERFVDVFLGSNQEYGVPVWVIPNPISRGAVKFISNDVIEKVRQEDYEIFPYREIDAGIDAVELIAPGIWRRRSDLAPEFSGWAVYLDDPLWPGPAAKSDLPLQIVLNRQLFEQQFDVAAYGDALRHRVPKDLSAEAADATADEEGKPGTLWLRLQVNQQSVLLPFEIIWVERIPTIRDLAFLFPLPTYHALREAANYPDLRYFPELEGGEGNRLKRIAFSGNVAEADLQRFVDTLGGQVISARGRRIVSFKKPQPEMFVEAFARERTLDYRVLESVKGHAIGDRRSHMALPCSVFPRRELRRLGRIDDGKAQCMVAKDVTSTGNGFLRAFVYVPDRTSLKGSVNTLLQIADRALSIHPIYQDALNRFGFLATMIDTLRVPYGFILFFFLLAILGIQIGTLVEHRRQRYGVFLVKGVPWHHIYSLLFMQMVFAVSVGLLGAAVIMSLMQRIVSSIVRGAADAFRGVIQVVDIELLPLTMHDYAAVTVSTLVLALSFVAVILYLLPVRWRTQIGPLLKD